MMPSYYTRERGLIARADGGIPTSIIRALFVPPDMRSTLGVTLFRMALGYGRIQNRSGVTSPVGFAARAARNQWVAGQIDGAGIYTDDTTDAQDTDVGDFALTGLGANSGFLVACRNPINLLAILVSTVEAGAPVYQMQYSQAGGTWGTLTNLLSAPAFTSAAEKLIWWVTPPDLDVLESGHGTGVPTGLYGYRMRATTAPTTAPLATSLSVFEAVQARENVTDNTNAEFAPSRSEHKFSVLADSLYGVVDDVTALFSVALAEVRVY